MTGSKIYQGVFGEIIFYLIEVSFCKDESEIKVPCNIANERVIGRFG
jgi:hypothetical protein